MLDEREDRRRIINGVVDESGPGKWRDHDGGHACTGSPSVTLRWRDVVPEATVLVVRDDDDGVLPIRSRAHRFDERHDVMFSPEDVAIAGMFVDRAQWLDERYGGKRALRRASQKVLFVQEMFTLCSRAVGVAFEIDERLMMILKAAVRVSCDRVVPTTGEP